MSRADWEGVSILFVGLVLLVLYGAVLFQAGDAEAELREARIDCMAAGGTDCK